MAELKPVIEQSVSSSRDPRDVAYHAHLLKRITKEGKLHLYECINTDTA